VFHDATTMKHAKKALDANADGIIAVCGGAGGHAGTYNPFAFLTELRQIAGDKTIILAGAVSNGQSVAGAIAAGADLVLIGTRFISTKESMAPLEQKTMICESDIDDIVHTAEVSGIGANSGRPADFGRSRYGESIAKPEVSD
jgi:nitronate monooxygenase